MSSMKTRMIKDVPDQALYIMAAMFFVDAIIASELEVVHMLGQWWSSIVAGAYLLLWVLAIAGLLILATDKTDCNQTMSQNSRRKSKIFST